MPGPVGLICFVLAIQGRLLLLAALFTYFVHLSVISASVQSRTEGCLTNSLTCPGPCIVSPFTAGSLLALAA